MNVQRFTFALQHEDPLVVASGLRTFSSLCLSEHESEQSFGYNGRGVVGSGVGGRGRVKGLLAAYLRSSPRLEELFVLWGLPELDADRALAQALMQCLAVIFHCIVGEEAFCTDLVSRVLHEKSKAIKDQLASGSVPLVHATLGLVLSLLRTSAQSCRDAYDRCIIMSVPVLSTLSQKGKTVSWESSSSAAGAGDGGGKLSTDSRTLIIILLLTLLQQADVNLANDLLGPSSLLRKITNTVDKDTPEGARLVLHGLHDWLRDCSHVALGTKVLLVDANFQQRLLEMYKSSTEESLHKPLHAFMLAYCHSLCEGIRKKSGGPGATSVAHSGALQLIFKLDAHLDTRHRELQAVLVAAHPSLLSKCVSSINTSWEPRASHVFLCAMSHLCRLVSTVELGPHFRAAVRKTREQQPGKDGRAEAVRALAAEVLKSILPPSLAKKDLVKIFLCPNALVQRMGLVYLLCVMQRLGRVLAAAGGLPDLATALGRVVHEALPDFTSLARLRSIYVELLLGAGGGEEGSAGVTKRSRVEGADSSNSSGSSVKADDKDKAIYFLTLIHQIMEGYLGVSQASALGNFDVLRLLDDLVPWSAGESTRGARKLLDAVDSKLLLLTLRLLRQATLSNSCKWLGSLDDAKKLLNNLLVSPDWRAGTKRSPLAKLLLLAGCGSEGSLLPASRSAAEIFKLVLVQSEMFTGHGVVDYELGQEMNAWRAIAGTAAPTPLADAPSVAQSLWPAEDTVLLLDALLRLSFHWVAALAMQAAGAVSSCSAIGAKQQSFYVASLVDEHEHAAPSSEVISAPGDYLPFSPVLFCALALSCGNLDAFGAQLPEHIRRHVCQGSGNNDDDSAQEDDKTGAGGAVLVKFGDTVAPALQQLTASLLLRAATSARNRDTYGRLVRVVCDNAESTSHLVRGAANTTHASPLPSFSGVARGMQLVLSASHPTAPAASVEAYKSWTSQTSGKAGIAGKRGLSASKTDSALLPALASAVQASWFLSACITLKEASPSAAVEELITSAVETEQRALVGGGGGLEARVVLLRQCIDLLFLICGGEAGAQSAQGSAAHTLSKRSKKSAVAALTHAMSSESPSRLISLLTQTSMDILESTQTAPLAAAALYTSYLENHMLGPLLFGRCCRQILCTAAAAHLRRHANAKKDARVQAEPLWEMIARALHAVGEQDFGRISGDPGLFCLGWVVQRFVTHAAFRSLFVDVALLDGEGHRLLEVALGRDQADEGRDSKEGGGMAVCCPVGAVALLVLRSAASKTLTAALATSLRHVSGPLTRQANALYALSVGLKMHTSMARGWHHPRVSYFCDPLSLAAPSAIAAIGVELCAGGSVRVLSQLLSIRAELPVALGAAVSSADAGTKLVLALSQACLPNSLRLQVPVKLTEGLACLGLAWSEGAGLQAGDMTLLARALGLDSLLSEQGDLQQQYGEQEGQRGADPASMAVCALLDHAAVRVRHFTHNLAALLLRTAGPVLVQRQARHAFCLFALASALPVVLESAESEAVELWAAAYEAVLCQGLAEVGAILKDADRDREQGHKGGAAGPSMQAYLRRLLLLCYHLLTLRPDCASASVRSRFAQLLATLLRHKDVLKKRLNQWVRACLKFGLPDERVVSVLCGVVWQNGYCEARGRAGAASLWAAFTPMEGDFFHHSTLLGMVVGHSKFTQVLWGKGSARGGEALLAALLRLVVLVTAPLPAAAHDAAAAEGHFAFLVTALLPLYHGTTSQSDRTILRLLHLLARAGKCPSPATLRARGMGPGTRTGAGSVDGHWITSCLAAGTVYSSFQQVCLWRSVVPQPLEAEGRLGARLHAEQMRGLYRDAERAWGEGEQGGQEDEEDDAGVMDVVREEVGRSEAGGLAGDEEDDEDDEEEEAPENEEDEEVEEDDDGDREDDDDDDEEQQSGPRGAPLTEDPDEAAPRTDRPSAGSERVYDPCYWLPAAQHALYSSEVSIRQLANNGMVSLVVLALSSACPLLRSYALSCLQQIFTLLRRQGPDKDAGFKERPQLLLLLNFVRNAVVGGDGASQPLSAACARLPPTVAAFLGRAALHLLQPSHELFGKINKYLLSRPYCDAKDVPLYDMCVTQGDAEGEMGEKIAALRLLRDSFSSHHDHLNLCRKNAYQALTLLFPVLVTSANAVLGHAVLDVVDKALGMPHSARYLLERCMVVCWLRQQASPLAALKLVLPGEAVNVRETQAGRDEGDSDDDEDGAGGGGEGGESEASQGPAADARSEQLAWRGLEGAASDLGPSPPETLKHALYPLAAPARLVARTISILRRALGAIYLTPQGGSALLAAVGLAARSVAEEVAVLHAAGRARAVPRDVLRQTVLLLWDVSLQACAAGEAVASTRGHSGPFDWSPRSLCALSQALLSSSQNPASDADLDELVVSLVLLRGFEGGQDVVRGPGAAACARDHASIIRLTCGATLRLLHCAGRTSPLSPALALARPAAKLDGTYYYAYQRAQCEERPSAAVYSSVVHTLHRDLKPEGPCGVDEPRGHDEGEGDEEGEGEGENEEETLSRAWEALADTKLESTPLPTTLGQAAIIALASRALLCSLRGMLLNANADVQSALVLVEALRWVLLVRGVFSCSMEAGGGGVMRQAARRVLCTMDGGSLATHSEAFCEFQAGVRFAVACAWSLAGLPAPPRGSVAAEAVAALLRLVRCLRCSAPAAPSSAAAPSPLRALLLDFEVSELDAETVTLWADDDGAARGPALRCCRAALDLAATLVSAVDRQSLADPALGLWAVLHAALESDSEQRAALRYALEAMTTRLDEMPVRPGGMEVEEAEAEVARGGDLGPLARALQGPIVSSEYLRLNGDVELSV